MNTKTNDKPNKELGAEKNSEETPENTAVDLFGALGVDDVAEWERQGRRFRHLLEKGIEPGPWVVVEADILEESQVPSGNDRRDLSSIYAAMETIAEMQTIVNHGLGSVSEDDELLKHGVSVEHIAEGETVISVTVEGQRHWPEELGGEALEGEIERRFTIVVRRAAWRDRKVRRLAKITATSVQLHPDPHNTEL